MSWFWRGSLNDPEILKELVDPNTRKKIEDVLKKKKEEKSRNQLQIVAAVSIAILVFLLIGILQWLTSGR
jgi:hypothetical protein